MKTIEKIELVIFILVFFAIIGALIITAVSETSVNIAQVLLMFALVLITYIYARRTTEIAKATKEQADEIKRQRIMASRPIIIQKSVVETETEFRKFGSKNWFSYFEVYNAGNGPAIEVEISLMSSKKTPVHSHRVSFLRAGETPMVFEPKELYSTEESNFYLTTEYKSLLSTKEQLTWYQTWLPFRTSKASEKGRIYVIPGELEFREVSEKDRIDAFSSVGKPK